MQRRRFNPELLNSMRWGLLLAVAFFCITLLSVQAALADGSYIYYQVEGCYDIKSFGVGLYGDGAGSLTVSVPGEVADAYIYWVGVEDTTPAGDGTSILLIGNGGPPQTITGQLFPGEAGIATRPNPDWYGWYADIGPKGAGIITQAGETTVNISGWDNSNDRTNGASIAVIYSTGDCDSPRRVYLKGGIDSYFWRDDAERFTELLIYEFPAEPEPRIASIRFSHAGKDSTAVNCRGGAIWMLAGDNAPPDRVTFDLVDRDPNTLRGFGINGAVEIVNDPFDGPSLGCTPAVNPAPDQPYAAGHPYPGGAADAPYRAIGIDPPDGGNIAPEWGIVEVEIVVPAGATWVAFQLESEADQSGESGSWSGGGFLIPSPRLAVLKYNDGNGDGVFTDLEEAPADGITVTFKAVIANTSVQPLTITSISDDLHGANDQLTTASGLTPACADVLGTVLAPNQSIICYFDGTISVGADGQEVDTVTVTAVAEDNTQVSAFDTSTVTAPPPPALPEIEVDKVADPVSLPEPGGEVTFTVTVTNTVDEPLTLISLIDDIHGDLNNRGSCSVPQPLPVGGSYTCQFTATVTGNAGDSETDIITAIAEDEDGNQAEDSDDATVVITPVPSVAILKTLNLSGDAADGIVTVGQSLTYTVRVTNTSQVTLTVVPLEDTYDPVYLSFLRAAPQPDNAATPGTLRWDDLTGAGVLPPQNALTVDVTFEAITSTNNLPNQQTINVAVVDGATDGTTVLPPVADDAPVRITDPRVAVAKITSDPADGLVEVNDLVTFTIAITNTGDTTLDIIPVNDIFEPAELSYIRTSLATQPQVTDGELFWPDVSTELGNLTPGQAVTFTITFRFISETVAATINIVRLGETIDENGDPAGQPQGQSDAVVVVKDPTPVTLLSFHATVRGEGVVIGWVTGAEIDVFGFHLWQGSNNDRTQGARITSELIPSRGSSGQGAVYRHIQPGLPEGAAFYWLEEVTTTGERNFYGPITLQLPPDNVAEDVQLYLPQLAR